MINVRSLGAIFYWIGFTILSAPMSAQKQDVKAFLDPETVKKHVFYLASDALMGRNTGEPGNVLAADYIASQFKHYGVEVVNGQTNYFQDLNMASVTPGDGYVKLFQQEYKQNEQALFVSGAAAEISAPMVYLGFGDNEQQYVQADIKDKVVIVWLGSEDDRSLYKAIGLSSSKRSWATKSGAKAIIEVYHMSMPWTVVKGFLGKSRMVSSDETSSMVHALVQIEDDDIKTKIKAVKGEEVHLNYSGMEKQIIQAVNVLGFIPGTEETMQGEYILLSAHFDHVGSKASTKPDQDTIYNGTRDNAIGAAAILAAAEYFAAHPPKRSLILAAWNGEEKGLLGSKHFVANPWIPLNKIRFNLNIDNAGYNDTALVSVIGLDRTGATLELTDACLQMGLKVLGDPAPEQNLFDRSDNVSFAKIGIPAPTFSLGFTSFNQDISKYYHQVEDNPESVDYNYLNKYWAAYILAAERIANKTENIKWQTGDKYEEAAKSLYGSKY